MDGGLFLVLLITVSSLVYWLRQRQVRGWKGPLFRRRTYNAKAAIGAEASKGEWIHHGPPQTGGGGGGF